MKNFLMILLAAISVGAVAQVQLPAASSAGTVSSRVGLTDVKVDYSRPKMKGRKIFGEGADFLLPYGKIWRTGANNGTKISFSEDVKVEGVSVPKGEYLIFSWPGAAEWSVSLYKDLELGGNTDGYDAKNEVAKVKVKPETGPKVETFTIAIGDISEDNSSAKVQIAWENTSVKFGIWVDNDSKILSGLDASAMAGAHYYFDYKKDAKTAVKWADEYFANGKHAEEFWNIHYKAQIQSAAGDKAGAAATAQKSLDIAKAAAAKQNNGDFGYIKRNEDLIKEIGPLTPPAKKKK